MPLNKNAFGNLVRAYRKQRGWTQEELAERWGYTREYVSQIEAGRKKLDSVAQVVRLADILDIPQEKLEAIGRGIPQRKIDAQEPKQADSAILQMLLAPGQDMARISYLAWVADQQPEIEENLNGLVFTLEQALTWYRGEFVKPTQELLAYTHQMLGRIAYDRLDFAGASGHASEMIDLGQELNDPDIIIVGMVRQGSILRKRGRYESALRCFEATNQYMEASSTDVQGQRLIHIAATYADKGDIEGFDRTIDAALELTGRLKPSISALVNEFSLEEVLLEQAAGSTELWKPERAIEVYKETDRLRPFRPMRERGRNLLWKGQAHLFSEDIDQGMKLSLEGLALATAYQSKRHVGWLEKTYNRLRVLPIGQGKRLDPLRDALVEARRKQEKW